MLLQLIIKFFLGILGAALLVLFSWYVVEHYVKSDEEEALEKARKEGNVEQLLAKGKITKEQIQKIDDQIEKRLDFGKLFNMALIVMIPIILLVILMNLLTQ